MFYTLLFCLSLSLPCFAVTFLESVRAAQAKNELVSQAQLKVQAVEAQTDAIRGAVFPQISVDASHLIQPLPSNTVAQEFSPAHQTQISAGVRQKLFQGFREFAALRQRRALYSAELASQSQTLSKLYEDVAASYLNVLSFEFDLKNLQEQGTIYHERTLDLRARVRRGESAESEVISSEATQASLEAEMRLVQGQLLEAREGFQFLTGLDRDSALEDPDLLKGGKKSLPALEGFLQKAEERPDVQAARELYRASEEGVSIAWGAHLPTLDAYADYYFMRPGFLKDLKWDIGIKLTVPLFEGGATQAGVRQAIAVRGQKELELGRVRRVALKEIRALYERLQARVAHIEGLEKSVSLSTRNVGLLQKEFRRGLARNIDIQLALTELRNAKRGLDRARFSGQIEFCQLQAAAASIPAEMKGTSP